MGEPAFTWNLSPRIPRAYETSVVSRFGSPRWNRKKLAQEPPRPTPPAKPLLTQQVSSRIEAARARRDMQGIAGKAYLDEMRDVLAWAGSALSRKLRKHHIELSELILEIVDRYRLLLDVFPGLIKDTQYLRNSKKMLLQLARTRAHQLDAVIVRLEQRVADQERNIQKMVAAEREAIDRLAELKRAAATETESAENAKRECDGQRRRLAFEAQKLEQVESRQTTAATATAALLVKLRGLEELLDKTRADLERAEAAVLVAETDVEVAAGADRALQHQITEMNMQADVDEERMVRRRTTAAALGASSDAQLGKQASPLASAIQKKCSELAHKRKKRVASSGNASPSVRRPSVTTPRRLSSSQRVPPSVSALGAASPAKLRRFSTQSTTDTTQRTASRLTSSVDRVALAQELGEERSVPHGVRRPSLPAGVNSLEKTVLAMSLDGMTMSRTSSIVSPRRRGLSHAPRVSDQPT